MRKEQSNSLTTWWAPLVAGLLTTDCQDTHNESQIAIYALQTLGFSM